MARIALRMLVSRIISWLFFYGLLLIGLTAPNAAFSSQGISQICTRAAAHAAQKTGVPVSVLQAISLTETGRKRSGEMQPWPWTVNMEGKGVWFNTKDDAQAYVYKNYKRGARSFDVGCFQINYKWHSQAFASIEEMFEPIPNAIYAAEFLLKLYREKGNWTDAAGAYHSRTPKYAKRYQARFNENRKRLLNNDHAPQLTLRMASADGTGMQHTNRESVIRINLYPLLQNDGQSRTLGSLVSLNRQQTGQPIIKMSDADG